ncbi:hypothetical protein K505DRAFT_51947 [Melanomma pulvis-pyrius CBS 109.77]|uniref:Uncharacterized protein n=1 Tax=Melanomma pulvis-pyrius CBS 109.77 TaxID=1314802 RepID=A0A6A6X8K2_9PLEO|nr:hypothetical protein K505DRAFT_51947 [Melanomma pulvis-pyrius CBS 109.77]
MMFEAVICSSKTVRRRTECRSDAHFTIQAPCRFCCLTMDVRCPSPLASSLNLGYRALLSGIFLQFPLSAIYTECLFIFLFWSFLVAQVPDDCSGSRLKRPRADSERVLILAECWFHKTREGTYGCTSGNSKLKIAT